MLSFDDICRPSCTSLGIHIVIHGVSRNSAVICVSLSPNIYFAVFVYHLAATSPMFSHSPAVFPKS